MRIALADLQDQPHNRRTVKECSFFRNWRRCSCLQVRMSGFLYLFKHSDP